MDRKKVRQFFGEVGRRWSCENGEECITIDSMQLFINELQNTLDSVKTMSNNMDDIVIELSSAAEYEYGYRAFSAEFYYFREEDDYEYAKRKLDEEIEKQVADERERDAVKQLTRQYLHIQKALQRAGISLDSLGAD